MATRGARPRLFDWTMPVSGSFVLLLGLLVLLPMFWLALTSLRDDARMFTLGNYRQIFTDPSFLKPLFTTLWTSAAVATLCVAVAAPMAWLVSRTDLPAQRTLRMLILASFVTPPFLGAFAWVLLGGPNAGLINQWYYALFGLKAFEAQPLLNIFSAGGMVFVMALYTFPYVFTFVANSLDLIPSELEEASAILGAPPWRSALNVTLPLVMPALLAGFLVAFLQPMMLFGVPAILALPHGGCSAVALRRTRQSLHAAFLLGLRAAAAGTLLATTVGYLSLRKLVWGHRWIAVLATAPVAIPGIVLAVGLFLSYTRPPLVLYGTLSIIFLAYLTKELPVGYQTIGASLKAVHPELEDASRIFGATRLRALADITAPPVPN